jgi:anti-sigma factor RsiW
MQCREVRELLHPYVDGELAPAEAQAVAEELARCKACKAEHDELQGVRAMAREAFLAPVEAVDLSSVYGGVMARLAAGRETLADSDISGVPVAREDKEPKPSEGVWTRLGQFLSGLVSFENPALSWAAAAALILVGVGIWRFGGGASETALVPSQGPAITAAQPPTTSPNGKRRDRAAETGFVRKTEFVTVEEVARGRVEIEQAGGPNEPVVVWHVVEGEPSPEPPDGR